MGSFLIFGLLCVSFALFSSSTASMLSNERIHGVSTYATGDFANHKFYYETTQTKRNQTLTRIQCEKIRKMNLAVVNKNILEEFKLEDFPPVGMYWVNGKTEDNGIGSLFKFDGDAKCTESKDAFNLKDVNVTTPSFTTYCLALVKGANYDATFLKQEPCTTPLLALCSEPMSKCSDPK